jgi:hypothetical protein
MELSCIRCDKVFDSGAARGYCAECIAAFDATRAAIHKRQRPAPGVYADGKFADPKECPQSVQDPVMKRQVCGVCGSDELEPGYGIAGGYGMGSYTFCCGCNRFLDFFEDTGE